MRKFMLALALSVFAVGAQASTVMSAPCPGYVSCITGIKDLPFEGSLWDVSIVGDFYQTFPNVSDYPLFWGDAARAQAGIYALADVLVDHLSGYTPTNFLYSSNGQQAVSNGLFIGYAEYLPNSGGGTGWGYVVSTNYPSPNGPAVMEVNGPTTYYQAIAPHALFTRAVPEPSTASLVLLSLLALVLKRRSISMERDSSNNASV